MSRLLYAQTLAAQSSLGLSKELEAVWYRSTKALLGIKFKPNKSHYLKTVLGIDFKEHLGNLYTKALA
jgi:hypothetical protein